jgi:hypothetical protein
MGNVDLFSDMPTNITTEAKGSNSALVKTKGHKKIRIIVIIYDRGTPSAFLKYTDLLQEKPIP